MSSRKLYEEAQRWYRQAQDDLEAAEVLLIAEKYAQTCFYAQHAGEKALKAVWFFLDLDPWGHSCTKLIKDLPNEGKYFSEIIDTAKALDKLYIPTRYPDALAEITPAEAFTKHEAKAAIALSQGLLRKVNSRIVENDNLADPASLEDDD